MAVAKDLQPVIRRKEIRRSLKTCSLRLAKMKAQLIAGHLHAIFQHFGDERDMIQNSIPHDRVRVVLDQAFRVKLIFTEATSQLIRSQS